MTFGLNQLVAPLGFLICGLFGASPAISPTSCTLAPAVAAVSQASCECDFKLRFHQNTCGCQMMVTFFNFGRAKCTPMPACGQIEDQCKTSWTMTWIDPGGLPGCVGGANLPNLATGCTTTVAANPACPLNPVQFGIVSLECLACAP